MALEKIIFEADLNISVFNRNARLIEAAFSRMEKSAMKVGNAIQGLTQRQIEGIGRTKTMMNELNRTTKNFAGIARQNELALRSMFVRNQGPAKKLIGFMRQFNMELLGATFFGQMLSTRMFGLLAPSAELFGVFDLLRTGLEIFFLPIMEKIFPIIIDFFEWFISRSDEFKIVVGGFVAFLGALGVALASGGAIGLGLSSLIQLFEKFFGTAGTDKVVNKLDDILDVLKEILDEVDDLEKEDSLGEKLFDTDILDTKSKKFKTKYKSNLKDIGKIGLGVIEGFTAFKLLDFVLPEKAGLDSVGGFARGVTNIIGLPFQFLENVIDETFKVISDFFNKTETDSKQNSKVLKNNFSDATDNISSGMNTLQSHFNTTWVSISDIMSTNIESASSKSVLALDNVLTKTNEVADGFIKLATGTVAKFNESKVKEVFDRLPGGGTAFGGSPLFTGRAGEKAPGIDSVNDFILKPDGQLIKTHPNDTLVGFKGASPFGGQGVTVNQTINATTSNKSEIESLLRISNARLVDDVKRLIGA